MVSDSTATGEVTLDIELAQKINYSLAQWMSSTHRSGAAQFIRKLEVHNNSDMALENCRLKITAQPEFVIPRTWNVDRIEAKSTFSLTDAAPQLDTGFLWSIPETISGTVRFEWSADGTEPVCQNCPVELVAPTHWVGGLQPLELIAAHVLPNDPEVAKILKVASAELRKAGKPSGLDGYQSGSPRRVAEIMEAIWNAVLTLNLSYSYPPASFEESGQKVRTPSQIAQEGLATCLDTATLFAACLEQSGINPLVVFIDGHAFTGAWIVDQTFEEASTQDASALLKGIALKELLFFETTAVTGQEKIPFYQAIAERSIPPVIHGAVDIVRARKFGITPIALPGTSRRVTDPDNVIYGKGLQDSGWLDQFADTPSTSNASLNNASDTQLGRLHEWQKKLLDLSARNPLLDFKATRKSIPLICSDTGVLEDKLAQGDRFQILAPPMEVMQKNDSEGTTLRLLEYAHQIFPEKKLIATLGETELENRLIQLMRTGKRDLQEGGANTLFLALGFLAWHDPKSRNTKMNFAPLVLIPISLERKNARSRIILSGLDEEARFNATLLELLKQDFGISIPELENELPKDDHGLDVERIYQLVTSAVRNCEGWLVTHDIQLSTFSFARYLMWRDLREQGDVLKENQLVRHLVDTPLEQYKSEIAFPQTRALDQHYLPSQIFMPLPADSSQITAALAAAAGKDFVLIGPPGTGKSQSIVNMISHCLAEGKKVLFVSAKKAALDVVYRRLREVGLDDFCLEVHSSKESNRNAYEQLKRAAARANEIPPDGDWQRETARLSEQISTLNQYVSHLHHEYPNGLTPYRAIGNLLTAPSTPAIDFSWHDPATHNREQYEAMSAAAQALALAFPQFIDAESRTTLSRVHITDWSPSGEEHFAQTTRECARLLHDFETTRLSFITALSPALPVADILSTSTACTALLKTAKTLIEHRGQATKVLFVRDAKTLKEQIAAAVQTLAKYRKEWNALSCPYREEAAATLDAEQLEKEWREAVSQMWPKRIFAENAVQRILQTATVDGAKPDPTNDIPHLKQWQKARLELETFEPLTKSTFDLWQGANTDLEALQSGCKEALSQGTEINSSILQCSNNDAAQETLRKAAATLLHKAEETPAHTAAQQLIDAYQQLEPQLKELQNVLNSPFKEIIDTAQNGWIPELASRCEKWHQVAGQLRTWSKWQGERQTALQLDLAPLVNALENNHIEPAQAPQAFEINYKRWWLRAVIDNDAVLRSFTGKEQEFTVQAFAENIDNYLQLTRRYIRARIAAHHQMARSKEEEEAMGLLTRELKKKMRFKPLRHMIGVANSAILRLTPCMMMSPLSVAQFLALGKRLFDVVIFDEASQIPVWDSIGALARGDQSVIVGDPKQMPPTDFFSRGNGEEEEEDENTLESAESILDECIASRVPMLGLDWHYRSRSENLIAFSNHHYYDDQLITFPAPQTRDASVSFHYVAEGTYAAGKARHNEIEAKAVVADIVAHLKAPAANNEKLTVGVVTFNSQQQKLIEDLLDAERRADPSLEKWFNDSQLEPVMVKNLESVQGDERDIMYFSVTFGPTLEGRISMNFGPLNKDGGERRLNVAITRARHQLKVFASFRPEQIDLTRTGSIGVRDFKHFMEFAERGAASFARAADITGRPFESCFEEAVSDALTRRGWTIHPQVGVAKFRIDLGVVHPDFPGQYLAGVECDGATYHSAATARDRDKVREGVLRGLGWNILRVWSTDWWNNPERIIDQLDAQLKLLQKQTPPPIVPEVPPTPKVLLPEKSDTPKVLSPETKVLSATPAVSTTAPEADNTRNIPSPSGITTYAMANVDDLEVKPDANRFYDAEYDEQLLQLIEAIITAEGPILEEVLIKRTTRAHHFSRVGGRIRTRLQSLIKGKFHTSPEASTKIYWSSAASEENWNQFRQPAPGDEARTIEEIPLVELRVLANIVQATETEKGALMRQMAKHCGISRLGDNVRARLEMVLEEK